jgi:hypothetical protein
MGSSLDKERLMRPPEIRYRVFSTIAIFVLGACSFGESSDPELNDTDLDTCRVSPDGGMTCTTCAPPEYAVVCDPETPDDPSCAEVPGGDGDGGGDDGGGDDGGVGGPDGGPGGGGGDGGLPQRDAGVGGEATGSKITFSNPEIIYFIIRPVTQGLWTGYLEGYVFHEGIGQIGPVIRSTRPALQGGRLVDHAAWRDLADRGRTLANQHAARMPNLTCRVRVMTVGVRFAIVAIVMLAYTGYVDAAQAAANRIIPQWEAFYGNCRHIADWFQRADVPLNPQTARSCRDCYNAYFPAPGTGAISICTDGQGQEVYNGLRDDIGERGYRRAEGCAALPGGYYSQRFTTPLFRPDAPNIPTIDATCPY